MRLPQGYVFGAGILCILFHLTKSAKILAVFPFPGPSQYINAMLYLKTLASRGHEVTVINAFPQKTPIENFRDIPIMEVHDSYAEFIKDVSIQRNFWQEKTFISGLFTKVTNDTLENREVKQLLHSQETFDLIIIEVHRNDALYGLGPHFNAPLIGFSTLGTDWNIDELVGNTAPLSYIPHPLGSLTDRMDFWQRLQNFAQILFERIHTALISFPIQQEIYRKIFPNSIVPLNELRKNFSLILLNQHFSLSYPRPYVPNMIEVGGLHITQKTNPLPKHIEDFIIDAEHGVVYFSLGSNVKSKDLPPNRRELIVKVFSKLKQRVLWKFEDDQLPGKPANVFICKWCPQPDILAHPNVKLFITHGGLLSSMESIYHGKPILGLPVFYDQFLNVRRAKLAGYGLGLDFIKFTEADFDKSIERLLIEPSFTKVAKDMSKRYKDQPMLPLERAIWWTEYVLRHKGASHMRVAAQDLSFIALHSLDTLLVLTVGLISILTVKILIIWKIGKCFIKAKIDGPKKVN